LPKPSAAAVQRFEELTPDEPTVTTKLTFGQPSALVNGNLFFGVFGEELLVRLSESDRAEAGSLGGFLPFEPMPGHPMTGYLLLPTAFRTDRRKARAWVDRALRYAATLPPKKTKKKPG
jgi:TfoX/Sxy family transcriptional regulator of competence genes